VTRVLRALAGFALIGAAFAQTSIVVSIAPYREPLQRLAGPDATVDVQLPPGASPHAFDPTPRDVARLERADLIVVNGGLDDWALDLVSALGREVPVFVALDALSDDALLLGGHDHEHGANDADEHAEDSTDGLAHDDHADEHADEHADDEEHDRDANPHVWLDPTRMGTIVAAAAEALIALDPDAAGEVRAREQAYHAELAALDSELTTLLAPVAGEAFVPFHDAWPYFAERYDLNLIVEIEPFPGREPSARALGEALEAIRASGARAVFTEVQLADRPARVLADEAGVRLAVLDPVGGSEGRRGYLELLRYNAAVILEALRPTTATP
jgi:ABC-type Zn uptake system ZnuABC Zn-binding protein ZnuA